LSANTDPKQIRQLRRDVGMVFQQYHLWPHMTVLENLIEAPMKILGVGETEAKQQAMELLQRLRLEGHAEQFPATFIRWSTTAGGDCSRVNDETTSVVI